MKYKSKKTFFGTVASIITVAAILLFTMGIISEEIAVTWLIIAGGWLAIAVLIP